MVLIVPTNTKESNLSVSRSIENLGSAEPRLRMPVIASNKSHSAALCIRLNQIFGVGILREYSALIMDDRRRPVRTPTTCYDKLLMN